MAAGVREAFEEVPPAVLNAPWRILWARRFRRSEAITALEAEAAVMAVRACVRERPQLGLHHLFLSDSLAWAVR